MKIAQNPCRWKDIQNCLWTLWSLCALGPQLHSEEFLPNFICLNILTGSHQALLLITLSLSAARSSLPGLSHIFNLIHLCC